jgi:hypothetical protein
MDAASQPYPLKASTVDFERCPQLLKSSPDTKRARLFMCDPFKFAPDKASGVTC